MDTCIFCKIAKREIGSDIIYEDDDFIVFKDIKPVAPVHVLLIPKKHIESLNTLDINKMPEMARIFSIIQKMAKDLGIDNTGYRTISNCGSHGGQSVAHLHFHIIGGKALRWTF